MGIRSSILLKPILFISISLSLGCGSSRPSAERPTKLEGTSTKPSPTLVVDPEFDFGLILAQGQTLRHNHTVKNMTNRLVRLTEAKAFVPCCSTVETFPAMIPPGEQATIQVVFRPGYQSGQKRLDFSIKTDLPGMPALIFAAFAQLTPEWEVQLVGEGLERVALNRPGRIVYRVTCRRRGEEGRKAPVGLRTSVGVSARFLAPPLGTKREGGFIEESREVAVDLRPTNEPGIRSDRIELLWHDGQKQTVPITWEVLPTLRVAPSGFTLSKSEGLVEKVVTIVSNRGEFRVLKVSGPGFVKSLVERDGPGMRHNLRLSLDPSQIDQGQASDIRIRTDHSDQPEVTVSVLVLSEKEEPR